MDDRLGLRAEYRHPGKHVRSKCLRRVVENQPDLERARHRIELRVNVVNDSLPALSGQEVQLDLGLLTFSDPACLALENFNEHPYLVELGDRHDLGRRRYINTLADTEAGGVAISVCVHVDQAIGRPLPIKAADLVRRKAERRQAFPRCTDQRPVAAVQSGDIFLLRIDERRRIELKEELS